jgi:hypothetical protein
MIMLQYFCWSHIDSHDIVISTQCYANNDAYNCYVIARLSIVAADDYDDVFF